MADGWGVWLSYLFVGQVVFTPHALLGFTALALMVLHFVWLMLVFASEDKGRMMGFKRFGSCMDDVLFKRLFDGYSKDTVGCGGLPKLFYSLAANGAFERQGCTLKDESTE